MSSDQQKTASENARSLPLDPPLSYVNTRTCDGWPETSAASANPRRVSLGEVAVATLPVVAMSAHALTLASKVIR
jgi:hypothetical protein